MSPVVKRKKERFKLPAKYWLLILTCLCLLMIVLTFFLDFKITPANYVLGYTVVPFQKGIASIGTYFTEKAELISKVNELSEENKELRRQLDELTIENTTLLQDKFELNSLRKLYDLDQEYSDYPKTGATVIMGSTSNWFNTFIINKGKKDGLSIGMNVMSGSGLVGRITDVGPNWAKVLSLIDDTSNISAQVLSTSDQLIVSGDLETMENGYIRFTNLSDKNNEVAVGDKVVTSDISERFLPGILIGYISHIENDANNLTKSGYITPAVDFEHLSTVLVITQTKQKVDIE